MAGGGARGLHALVLRGSDARSDAAGAVRRAARPLKCNRGALELQGMSHAACWPMVA